MQQNRNRLRFLGLSAIMAGGLCVLSPITIPVGVVPITLSVFALFLVASLFPMRVALCATAIYLAVGALGLPVFSAFTGGFFAFVSPSGGFLWGYLPAVFTVAFFARKAGGRLWLLLVGLLLALAVLYAFGLFGFCILTESGVQEGLWTVILPFLFPDAAKVIAVLAVLRVLRRKTSFFSRDSF